MPSASPGDGGSVELLIIEDSPTELELELHALRRLHADGHIVVARNGEEAVERLFGDDPIRPRLIMLDLKLPKIGGLDVLRRIKDDDRTRTIPVAVFTSSDDERDVRSCYELGANSYVVKPLDFQRFDEAVRLLDGYWLGLNVTRTRGVLS